MRRVSNVPRAQGAASNVLMTLFIMSHEHHANIYANFQPTSSASHPASSASSILPLLVLLITSNKLLIHIQCLLDVVRSARS